jgi:hypothetical protein
MKRRTVLDGVAGSALTGALAGCIGVSGILNNTSTISATWGEPSWRLGARLAPPGEKESRSFGRALAVENGTIALIGDPGSGGAYVSTGSQSDWSRQGTLRPDDVDSDGRFGTAVALVGETALVGAPSAEGSEESTGAAYLFERADMDWHRRAKLRPDDPDPSGRFGAILALEGATALVGGSHAEDSNGVAGSVYAFSRGERGWSQQAKLVDPGGKRNASFGEKIAIEEDIALIEPPYAGSARSRSGSPGRVSVYRRMGGTWKQTTTLTRPSTGEYDHFRKNIVLDEKTALISASEPRSSADAPPHVITDTGDIHCMFERSGGRWIHQAIFRPPEREADDEHDDLDLSRQAAFDRGTALVISNEDLPEFDMPPGPSKRGAFVFERSQGEWNGAGRIAPDSIYGNESRWSFGSGVVLGETVALVNLERQGSEEREDVTAKAEVAVFTNTAAGTA